MVGDPHRAVCRLDRLAARTSRFVKIDAVTTSPIDRPNTAVLVIDMQRDVVANAADVDRVVGTIDGLVARARAEQVAVVWVQHADEHLVEGSDGWQLVPALEPTSGEPLVGKNFGDSFEETDLESLLEERDVGRLVVTGAQTDACIRSTLHGALVRGYDVTLVTDGHTTEDMQQWGSPVDAKQAIEYANFYWGHSAAAGRSGSTAPAADIDFSRR